MIGPAFCCCPQRGHKAGLSAADLDELKILNRAGRDLAGGRYSKIAAVYADFPKDSRHFLVSARTAFFAAVATVDEKLFDRVRSDIEAYPQRYASPHAAVGSRIMRNWIENFLGVSNGKPDHMRDFPLSDFPAEWRYAAALLVMKLLLGSGEYLASWGVSELLLNMMPVDLAADVHIKLTRALICQEMGRMEEADRWARATVESVRGKDIVLPFLGRLLGPKSPLEKNLRELDPELFERAKRLSGDFFRGCIRFHNRLTGDRCAENLTPREFYIVRQIRRGLTYKEIALRLGIAYSRVNELITELHEKLGVTTSAAMKKMVW